MIEANQPYMRKLQYETVLRNVWWSMLERYPQLYSFSDYRAACEKAGIPLF